MKHLIILTLTIIMVSCGTNNKMENRNLQKKWELNILNGIPITNKPPIYIELTEDNRIIGFSGCNSLGGVYAIDNNKIKFKNLSSTFLNCGKNKMELERQVFEMLNRTDDFNIENGTLNLNAGREEPLAKFIEVSNNEIVNKYWKLIQLDGKSVKMVDNQDKEQYFKLNDNGLLSGFAGCNHFHGEYELSNGSKIRFSENLGVTMKSCPNINESKFLEVFKLADNYTINGDILILNMEKRAPLAIFEAIYF